MTVHNGHMLETEARPITVAIERRIDPSRSVEATSWMQAGTDLAAHFDGFLGSGWVRTGEQSDLWYMLYRFRDLDTLEAWERSDQRSWWLDSGRVFAREVRIERRTGIEGWFDTPSSVEVISPTGAVPPRWKQMVSIFLVFFPLSLLSNWALSPITGAWPLPLRVLVTVLLVTPVMTYVAMPFVTRALRPWLTRGL